LFALGVTQQRAGQSRQAIITLTDAINSGALNGANAARAVFDRGLAYDSLGNAKAAIADYTEALRRDPSLSAAYNNRGNAYRRGGQFENANRDYLAALNTKGAAPQYPNYGLGLIAVQAGDLDHARTYFQKALAADPRFSPAAQSLASLNSKSAGKPAPATAVPQQRVAEVQLRPAISDAGNAVALVQLGAYRDEASAKAGWAKGQAVASGALDGLKPLIVTVDLPGKGRFWRLRVALAGRSIARVLCARLIDKGQSCIFVRD
jgi:tetratricopeptide (TPR) repeat protein